MNNRFIPSFHTSYTAEQKLTAAWCNEALQYTWYSSNNKSLLHGKNIEEIQQYASGKFDMTPYKRMFKSLRKNIDKNNQNPNLTMSDTDTTGLDWSCYAIIPPKLNSAISIIQKIPVEIKCTALDPLAAKKKQEDLNFLKNKPEVEDTLQQISDALGVDAPDLGTTQHSAIPYSSSPYGLDLNEPDELDVFVNLLYNLGVEVSYETAIQTFWEIKKINQVRLMETKDQFYYGVSVNRAFQNSITGLPDVEWVYPNNVLCPESDLPDFSDNTHRHIQTRVTALQFYNYFSSEIGSEGNMEQIINADKVGYCACNGNKNYIPFTQFDTFKVDLVYCEVKTVDWIGISANPKSKRGFKSLTTDPEKATAKLWGQNTIGFWWLKNTKYIYGIERLGFANRKQGEEAYQNFSTNIYKSQARSCVELCIGENKKAQIADIKMQHALLKSLPAGKYIDLRYIRGALSALKAQNNSYTIDTLINLAFEQNIMIGDTEGFEGKNDGQFKPFMDIAGGLKGEVEGYLRIMAEANRNIEAFSGINGQLTGQSANPEGLIGMQKLLVNASLNSLYYATEAIQNQCQQIAYLLANLIKMAIEKGGDTKQYIVNLIGSQKANIIDSLDEIPLHDMGVKVTVSQREEERAKFDESIYILKTQGVITAADEFMLNSITNPKDKYALLAVKEKQFRKREMEYRQQQAEQQQKLMEQQGQNQVAAVNAGVDGKIKVEYAKGDVQSKIISLAHNLGLNSAQFKAMVDRQLLQERQHGQIQKTVTQLQTKQNLKEQEAL